MTEEFVDALTSELREVAAQSEGGAGREIPTELRRRVEQRRKRGPRSLQAVAAVVCVAAGGVLVSNLDLALPSSSDKQSMRAQGGSSAPVSVTPCVGTARASITRLTGAASVPSGLELYSDGSTTVLGPAGWRCVRADTYDSAVLNISKRGDARNDAVTVQYAHVNSTTGLSLVCADFAEYGLRLDLAKARVDAFECVSKEAEVHTLSGPRTAHFRATPSRDDASSDSDAKVAGVIGSVIHNGASIDAGRIAKLSCTLSGPKAARLCSAIRSDYETNRFARTGPLTSRWTKIPSAGTTITSSRAVVLDAGALRLRYQAYSATPTSGNVASGEAMLREKFHQAVQKSALPYADTLLSETSSEQLSAPAAKALSKAKLAGRFEQAFVDETGAVYAWGNRRAVKIDASGTTTELASFPNVRNGLQSDIVGRSLFVWGGRRDAKTDDDGRVPSGEQEHSGYFMYFG